MTPKSCKISLISVDANVARLTALYVGVIFTLFMLSGAVGILLFLIVDFITRVFFDKKYSLLFLLAVQTKEMLNLATIKTDAAPKQFATVFGLIFLVSILCLYLFDFTTLYYICGAILLACIFLEVAFSYCLACTVYHLYNKVFV